MPWASASHTYSAAWDTAAVCSWAPCQSLLLALTGTTKAGLACSALPVWAQSMGSHPPQLSLLLPSRVWTKHIWASQGKSPWVFKTINTSTEMRAPVLLINSTLVFFLNCQKQLSDKHPLHLSVWFLCTEPSRIWKKTDRNKYSNKLPRHCIWTKLKSTNELKRNSNLSIHHRWNRHVRCDSYHLQNWHKNLQEIRRNGEELLFSLVWGYFSALEQMHTHSFAVHYRHSAFWSQRFECKH